MSHHSSHQGRTHTPSCEKMSCRSALYRRMEDGRWLTICLRNAIRGVLRGLFSSLTFTSVGSGWASSSLRCTVCKVDSTSSSLTVSTGGSHTAWIVLPGNKKVKQNKTTLPPPKYSPKTCFKKESWFSHPQSSCGFEPVTSSCVGKSSRGNIQDEFNELTDR